MSSNPEHPITMPENGIQPLDFIEQRSMLFKSTMQKIKSRPADSPPQRPLIQRVPPVLYNMKADFKKCFEPRLVSLGPLHHGKDKFKRAEQSKLEFAAKFAVDNNTTDDILFHKVKAEIEELRKCYHPDDIEEYDNDKLAWMLFIDGCAVLCAVHYGIESEFEKLNTKPDLLVFAQLDLFLLENQIPYRVLVILMKSTDPKWEQSLTKFIARNLITTIPGDEPEPKIQQRPVREDYAHLLERLREELLTGDGDTKHSSAIGRLLLKCGDSRRNRKTFRSIKELKESGINVKPTKTKNIKKISFSCNLLGKLMMPRLLVDDSTASKFLNLVALEMCRDFKNNSEVTTYLYFLDSLIDTPEDVKELRLTGMLHNYFGSDEEVAVLFNKMSKDLVPDLQEYSDVMKNIHKYCNNPWTAALSKLYYTHFSTPWTIIAFFGAIFELLFSATQAYFSLPSNKSGPCCSTH